MATTGTVKGGLMKIYIGSTAVTCQTSISLNLTTEMRDTTCFDSDIWGGKLPATNSWTADGEANLAFDATYGWTALFTAWRAQTGVSFFLKTGVSGDPIYYGNAYISSLGMSGAGNNENLTFSYTFEGDGAISTS